MIISLIWTLSILHYLSSIDHTLKCINDNLILILSKWSERPMLSNLYADLSQFLYSSSFQSFKAAIALCSVIQLCPTLCDSMEYSGPGSSVHGIDPGKNTCMGCHLLLQGIFTGIEPVSAAVPALAGRFFNNEPLGNTIHILFKNTHFSVHKSNSPFSLYLYFTGLRVHHEKRWAGRSTSWNQDCWEKYQ